jgi:hypothetical protein
MVREAGELASTWLRWLTQPQRRLTCGWAGREVLRAQQGSTERTLDFLAKVLSVPLAERAVPGAPEALIRPL